MQVVVTIALDGPSEAEMLPGLLRLLGGDSRRTTPGMVERPVVIPPGIPKSPHPPLDPPNAVSSVVEDVAQITHSEAAASLESEVPAPKKRGRPPLSAKHAAQQKLQLETPKVEAPAETLVETPTVEAAVARVIEYKEVTDIITALSRKKGLPVARKLVNDTFKVTRVADLPVEKYAEVIAAAEELMT